MTSTSSSGPCWPEDPPVPEAEIVTLINRAFRVAGGQARIVDIRRWPGSGLWLGPVCAVLIRDPHVGLKAYMGGTESPWRVIYHGMKLAPELGRAAFPGHDGEAWAES